MEKKILVLGAGKHQRIEGAEHHDRHKSEGIDTTGDLNKKTWAFFPANVYDQIICTHVVEHLDSLVNFMDNCHVLLKDDGELIIETPNAGTNPDLEFCDPTHIRCYRKGTFENYFTERGVDNFGYTSKAWTILEIGTYALEKANDVLRVKLTPIK